MTARPTALVPAALLALLALGTPAAASDLTDGIQQALDDVERQVEDVRIWKLRLRPTFGESLIWTDNVFLNDRGERPFRLTRVVGPNGQITDPVRLRRIQATIPDFQRVESEGRVDDVISRTELAASLLLPMNDSYSKLFDTRELTVLSARVRRHEYMDRNELDNGDFSLGTDVFALFSDLLDWTAGNRFWVRFGADHSRLEEPLDTDIVELQQIGIRSVDFKNFERTESEVRLDVGYDDGNRLDATLGGSWYRMRLRDDELRQSEYDQTNVHAEAGYDLPWFQDKRVYARADLDLVRPNDRAVDGSTQALNDGDRTRFVLGVEGAFLSKKIAGRLEAGYRAWQTDLGSGASGDTSDRHGAVGRAELAYQPFDGRKTRLQLAYERTTEASAISNFNDVHRGTLSLLHPIVPNTLDSDLTIGFTRTDASEGPRSRLLDVGLGVVYHAFDQVDVSLRYLCRYNDSRDELVIESSFARGSREFVFISHSDGDFFQNVVELGVDVRF